MCLSFWMKLPRHHALPSTHAFVEYCSTHTHTHTHIQVRAHTHTYVKWCTKSRYSVNKKNQLGLISHPPSLLKRSLLSPASAPILLHERTFFLFLSLSHTHTLSLSLYFSTPTIPPSPAQTTCHKYHAQHIHVMPHSPKQALSSPPLPHTTSSIALNRQRNK